MNKRDAKRAVARKVLALIKENETALFDQIVTSAEQDIRVKGSVGDQVRIREAYDALLALLEDRMKPHYDGKIRW
jgi:hypothetical protein